LSDTLTEVALVERGAHSLTAELATMSLSSVNSAPLSASEASLT
jgi:hypothetical protein